MSKIKLKLLNFYSLWYRAWEAVLLHRQQQVSKIQWNKVAHHDKILHVHQKLHKNGESVASLHVNERGGRCTAIYNFLSLRLKIMNVSWIDYYE